MILIILGLVDLLASAVGLFGLKGWLSFVLLLLFVKGLLSVVLSRNKIEMLGIFDMVSSFVIYSSFHCDVGPLSSIASAFLLLKAIMSFL